MSVCGVVCLMDVCLLLLTDDEGVDCGSTTCPGDETV